jgi:hypothetical protein
MQRELELKGLLRDYRKAFWRVDNSSWEKPSVP